MRSKEMVEVGGAEVDDRSSGSVEAWKREAVDLMDRASASGL